jgi:hypothetical protein
LGGWDVSITSYAKCSLHAETNVNDLSLNLFFGCGFVLGLW